MHLDGSPDNARASAGGYRATLTATDAAGNLSRPRRVFFQVTAG